MANIPIRDIASTGTPSGSSFMVFDDGVSMKRTTVDGIADAVRPVASESEATAGADNTKISTPLRVKQYVDSQVGVSLASKAQGDLANTALQPAAIGATVQAYDVDLTAIAGLTSAADKLPYFTGTGTAALADFTSFGRSLVDDADAAAGRATLGVVPGTDVQAYNARLADLASITYAQGDILYFNGTNLVKLTAGTSGQFLKTLGTTANPAWDTIPGGGNMLASNYASEYIGHEAAVRANIGVDIALDPMWYGAAGDGVTDDYSALVATIAAAKAAGKVVDGRFRTFKIGTGLNLDGVIVRNITLDGSDIASTVTMDGLSGIKAITYRNGPPLYTTTTSALTAQGNPGNFSIAVADGTKFARGDVILIRCNKNFDSTGLAKISEWKHVRSVSGNAVNLESPLLLTYALADSPVACKLDAAYTQVMRNVTIIGSHAGDNQFGFWGEYLYSPVFDRCHFEGCEAAALTCIESWAPIIPSLSVVDSDMDGNGYGLNIGGCAGANVGVVTGVNCRHVVTTGAGGGRGGNYYTLEWDTVIGGIVGLGSYGALFDSHPGTVGGSVGSVVGDIRGYPGEDGVMIQGVNWRIGHVDISGDCQSGAVVQYGGSVGIANPYFVIGHLNVKIPYSTDGQGYPIYVQNNSGALAQTIGLVKVGSITSDTPIGVLVEAQYGPIEMLEIGTGMVKVAGGDGIKISTYSGTAWVKRTNIRCNVTGGATGYGVYGSSAVASGGRIYCEAMTVTGFVYSFVASAMTIRRNDAVGAGYATGETSAGGGGSVVSIAAS